MRRRAARIKLVFYFDTMNLHCEYGYPTSTSTAPIWLTGLFHDRPPERDTMECFIDWVLSRHHKPYISYAKDLLLSALIYQT